MAKNCIFCNSNFPLTYQIIENNYRYWHLVHDIRPVCNFHLLLVSKIHVSDITSDNLPSEALGELGVLLKKSATAIKRVSDSIKTVIIVSLNLGNNSKHLHFHLIPVYKHENVRKMNDIKKDGSGLLFLAGKEIVDDTINDFINATCGSKANNILESIETARKEQIIANIKLIKRFL